MLRVHSLDAIAHNMFSSVGSLLLDCKRPTIARHLAVDRNFRPIPRQQLF
jgi:hypothetical protein